MFMLFFKKLKTIYSPDRVIGKDNGKRSFIDQLHIGIQPSLFGRTLGIPLRVFA